MIRLVNSQPFSTQISENVVGLQLYPRAPFQENQQPLRWLFSFSGSVLSSSPRPRSFPKGQLTALQPHQHHPLLKKITEIPSFAAMICRPFLPYLRRKRIIKIKSFHLLEAAS